jgi:hypothetical protein
MGDRAMARFKMTVILETNDDKEYYRRAAREISRIKAEKPNIDHDELISILTKGNATMSRRDPFGQRFYSDVISKIKQYGDLTCETTYDIISFEKLKDE